MLSEEQMLEQAYAKVYGRKLENDFERKGPLLKLVKEYTTIGLLEQMNDTSACFYTERAPEKAKELALDAALKIYAVTPMGISFDGKNKTQTVVVEMAEEIYQWLISDKKVSNENIS